MGEYRFSSLLKQNKKAKICFVIYIAGFFFKKISVMKCLRSKKRKSALLITTCGVRAGPGRLHLNACGCERIESIAGRMSEFVGCARDRALN